MFCFESVHGLCSFPHQSLVSFYCVHSEPKNTTSALEHSQMMKLKSLGLSSVGSIKAPAGLYLWSLKKSSVASMGQWVCSTERQLRSPPSHGVPCSPGRLFRPIASKLLLHTLSTRGISKGQPDRGIACEIKFFYKKWYHLPAFYFYYLFCLWNPSVKQYSSCWPT